MQQLAPELLLSAISDSLAPPSSTSSSLSSSVPLAVELSGRQQLLSSSPSNLWTPSPSALHHPLGIPDLSRHFFETSSAVPAPEKRRFDSIDRFNLFRRFGRAQPTTPSGFSNKNPGGFPRSSSMGFSDKTDISGTESDLLNAILEIEYPNLNKALHTDQSRISDKDFQLALLELIDLVSQRKR